MRKERIRNIVLTLALVYSVAHFVVSSGATSPTTTLRGDFSSGFPNFWAWRLNPGLIIQNPDVLAWMGREKIYLDKGFCDQTEIVRPLECETHRKQWVTNKHWLYGPTPHLLSFPLIFFDNFSRAYRIWWGICCICFLFTGWIWYQLLIAPIQASRFLKTSVFLFVWFNFAPAYEVLHAGEIEALQFFLLSACIYFATVKRELLSGCLLGFAVMTKFIPVVFIPYFLWKKRFKLAAVCLLTVAVLGVVAEVMFDWRWNYTLRFVFTDNKSISSTVVQTFSSGIYRFFTDASPFNSLPALYHYPPVTRPLLAETLSNIFILGVMGLFGFLLIKHKHPKLNAIELSIWFLLIVTLVKWNHYYYLIVLLVPFTLVAREVIFAIQDKNQAKRTHVLPLLSFLLVGFVVPGTVYQRITDYFGLPSFRVLYDFYSIAILGYSLLLIWLIAKFVRSKEGDLAFHN